MATLGLEEIFDRDALVLIEWGERFPQLMPAERTEIRLRDRGKRRKGNRSQTSHMSSQTNKQPWALILGASSGFGEATALELARAGMNIFGVHLDRRDKLPHVAEMQEQDPRAGPRSASSSTSTRPMTSKRKECVEQIRQRLAERADTPAGTLRVLLHSLAFGALKPLAGRGECRHKKQIEFTADIMGHSLVYWVQECLLAGLFDKGARIFAMTSSGGTRAIPNYGPVSAAKAILEAHIRQLALELAPAGITANAILAGVTDTPALRQIPGHEKLMEIARLRNPQQAPDDAGRRGALHRGAVPSGDLLADRQHPPRGWRREHRRMRTMDNELPCLDMLEATPAILRGLMCELSDEDARWKPAPDRFSVAEVLAHLSHSRRPLLSAAPGPLPERRESRIRTATTRRFHLDLYRNVDPEDAFDHFEEQRETNIESLRDLPRRGRRAQGGAQESRARSRWRRC